MKQRAALLLTLASFGLFTSCETEIDVTSDWEDVTVVYGLLDPAANTNWIRVQRGYLGSAPASASFNQPDSLYYDSLEVILQAYNVNSNGVSNPEGPPIRLNVDYETKDMEPGPFTTEDFRLYRTNASLDEDLRYELTVKKPGTDYPDARATTDLVGIKQSQFSGFRFLRPRDFATPTNPPEFNGNIEWAPSKNASIYEIDIDFHYKEFDRTTKDVVYKKISLDYETLSGFLSSTKVESKQNINSFYQMVAGNLEVNENKLRFFEKMKITVWAGGEHLETYVKLNEPSPGVNQAKPEFPQIENGTGLFSSRTKISLDNIVITTSADRPYYLNPILCDRNFALAQGLDTCFCRQVGEDYERYCP